MSGITAEQALDLLASKGADVKISDIREIVAQIDVGDGTGKTTVLYLGNYTDTTNGMHTEDAAKMLASQSDDIRIINQTEAAKFLTHEDVRFASRLNSSDFLRLIYSSCKSLFNRR
jgi:hypothetical protein